jgi:tryptophan-rich sensory protein
VVVDKEEVRVEEDKVGHDDKMPRPLHQVVALIVFLAICFGAAPLGGVASYPRIENWYASLAKPSWTPPDWIFGPVWTVLYACMAVAAWLVWRQQGMIAARIPLVIFGIQLVMNVAWSWLFFGLQSPGLAVIDIFLLLAAIIATLIAFWRRSGIAGLLLVPYFGWVGFASALNVAIWWMNSHLGA